MPYIIFETSTKLMVAIEENEQAVSLYNPSKYSYTHWKKGDPTPALFNSDGTPATFVDTRTYIEKRQAGYILESDQKYIEYQGCVEDGDDPVAAKKIWTDKRDAIKAKYPKP